ncbi:MAG: hypothetical protein GXO25_04280 [Euryarchaeota archaeon]|nr:hypothetical protein [Euryarchaeota archaeon]
MRGIYGILRSIATSAVPEDYGVPAIGGAVPVPISKSNFKFIDAIPARLCFVDGGNSHLFLAPGHAIHMVRLYASLFDGNTRKKEWRYTYIIDARYLPDKNRYRARIYDIDGSGIYPEEVMYIPEHIMKDERIKGVGAYMRRIGEWLLTKEIVDECEFIVRDGALQTGEKEEGIYASAVIAHMRDGKGIVGLSKTCTLLTDRGYSLVAAVHHTAERAGIRAPWYYNPLARGIDSIYGDMYVVKLHPASRYAFRAEVYPESLAERIFAALVVHSNDPEFLGYPYGLLDADIHARISDEEAKMYRTMLYDYVDEFSELEMNTLNAHDIISEVR